eukprot:2628740-Ditylum_brightwellii.AAC.1
MENHAKSEENQHTEDSATTPQQMEGGQSDDEKSSGSEYVPPNKEPFFGELGNVEVPDIADVNFGNDAFLNLLDVFPLAKAEWIAEDNNVMMEMEVIFQVPNLQGMTAVDCPSS